MRPYVASACDTDLVSMVLWVRTSVHVRAVRGQVHILYFYMIFPRFPLSSHVFARALGLPVSRRLSRHARVARPRRCTVSLSVSPFEGRHTPRLPGLHTLSRSVEARTCAIVFSCYTVTHTDSRLFTVQLYTDSGISYTTVDKPHRYNLISRSLHFASRR